MSIRVRELTSVLMVVFLLFSPLTLHAKRKHSDVENIGNRNINGRVAWVFPNFVSLEKEIQMGAQYSHALEQTLRLVEDPVVVQYIDDLGQKIVKHSDAKVPFVIKVIDSDEVNAFALMGGYFYVNKGLILEADNEAELAGVMAHEIAHVTARHSTERMTKGQLLQFASLPALFIGGYWTQQAIYNGLGMGMSLAVLGITRKSEQEADQLGTQYLWSASIDPNGFLSFFEKLEAKEKNKPGKFASFWRTHPLVEDRIARVQEEISYLTVKDEYVVSTSRFEQVKNRLIEIDNNITSSGSGEKGDPKRPTLKRKTGGGDKDKDKPTLKKKRPPLKRTDNPD